MAALTPTADAPEALGPTHPPAISAFYTYEAPAFLLALLLLWWKFGPVLPGTSLAGCMGACGLLLVRARHSSARERLVWCFIALVLLVLEARFAHKVWAISRSLIVAQSIGEGRLELSHRGSRITLPSVSLYVMDLDAMNRLQAARIEDDASYRPYVQHIILGDYDPDLSRSVFVRSPASSGAVTHYRLVFYTKYTMWWEDLETVNTGSLQGQAYRVIGYRGLSPKVLYSFQDPQFAQAIPSGPDWTWATREP